jgi:hypothetical protein
MGFTQADATGDKQRVIGQPGVLPDLKSSSPGQLVTFTLDVILEGIAGVYLPAGQLILWHLPLFYVGSNGPGSHGFLPYFDTDGWRRPAGAIANHIGNSAYAVRVNPVDDKAIWCQQPQALALFDRLQRPYPGIDLLLAEIRLQGLNTLIPNGRLHRG